MSQAIWVKLPNEKSQIQKVPLAVGVYRYWQNAKIIYVGKSITLKARLSSHLQNAKMDAKERAIVESATHIDYTIVDNDFKALLLEAQEIKLHHPVYNRILKDDKSELYITFNLKDQYPKLSLLRQTDLKTSNVTDSYGPFPTTEIAESVLGTIRRLVPYCRQKRVGKRACFYAHLGLCNPCPSYIEQIIDPNEKLILQKLYRQNIKHIKMILSGHYEPVIKELLREIKIASENKDYEQALKLRNKIVKFEKYISTHSFSDRRILSYNTSDSALTSLKLHLQLNNLSRIECFDASHSNFQDSTVAMVVATNGKLDRGEYKKFKLKRTINRSDFDQLEEALIRRFRNNWPLPNLLVIDGGAPQLRKLQKVLDQLPSAPHMIGLAKHPDHLVVPSISDSNKTILSYKRLDLPLSDHGLNLLQTLRDEAHRFGNKYRLKLQENKSKL